MNNFDSKEYDALALLANICQIVNFDMNIKEISNDDIMKKLIGQDKVLDAQTNIYLKTIIEQNKEILKSLNFIKNKILTI